MFCTKCGAQIPDGSAHCTQCGADLTQSRQQLGVEPLQDVPAVQPGVPAAQPAAGGVTKRLIAKIALLVSLICFFFPFVTVSCTYGGEETRSTYSGFELMTKIGADDDELLESGEADADDYSVNVFLIAAFAGSALALVLLLAKIKGKVPGILSSVSAVSLLLFMATFKIYYHFDELEEYAKYVEVENQFGLVLCLICVIIAAILSFLDKEKKSDTTSG